MFAKINEAHETLSNPKKRKVYDRLGMSSNEQQNVDPDFANMSFSWSDLWSNASQEAEDEEEGIDYDEAYQEFQDFFAFKRGKKTKGRDITLNIHLNFIDAINGTKRQVSFSRTSLCSTCNGNRCEPGTKIETCHGCGGTGFLKAGMKKIPCTICEGGKTMTKCSSCDGQGIQTEKAKEEVIIPRGVATGINLRLPGKGNYSLQSKSKPGDLLLQLEVGEHEFFQRRGKNIHSRIAISVPDAILGTEKTITTVKGEPRKIEIKPRTKPGAEIRLEGLGLEHEAGQKIGAAGDHFVTVDVNIPDQLSKEQEELYSQLRALEKY